MHRTIINIAFYAFILGAISSSVYNYFISLIFIILAIVSFFVLNPTSYSLLSQKKDSSILFEYYFKEKSDFLFALELAEPRSSYFDSDWDASWLTFLEHRLRSFSLGSKSDLEGLKTGMYKSIMIAGEGWNEFTENCIHNLKRFVSEGGNLILTRPYKSLEYFFTECDFKYITSLSELHSILLSDPVKPIIFSKKKVHTIFFNYGLISMAVRQGLPNNNYSISKKSIIKIRQKNSFDLCFNDEYASYPWIDRLDDEISKQLDFPEPKIGKKIIITHDEDYYQSTLSKVVSHETKKYKIQSVNFIIADSNISKDNIQQIIDTGSEIGIHWNCFKIHLDKTGLHYNPYKSLIEQIEILQKKLPATYCVNSNRTHWLKWDDSYTLPFEIISGAGIAIDTTLGAWLHHQGPIFGTMRPYRVLNSEGRPLPLHEIPTLVYDNTKWLNDTYFSDTFKNQCWLNVLFHPKPAINNITQNDSSWYRELLNLRKLGFTFTTLSEGIKQWKDYKIH